MTNRAGVFRLGKYYAHEVSEEVLTGIANAPFQDRPAPKFYVHLLAGGPSDQVHLVFAPDRVVFELPFAERFDFYFSRCLVVRPLLAALTARYSSLRGSCVLNLDDAPTAPGLAFCGTGPEHVLIPDPYFLGTVGYVDVWPDPPPWQDRKPIVFWRGSPTGFPNDPWYALPRAVVCLQAQAFDRSDLFDVRLTHYDAPDEDVAREVAASGILADRVDSQEFRAYKYGLDVDGYVNSWNGLFYKLGYQNVVLKLGSSYRQWYYDRLLPYYNFVPLPHPNGLLDAALWLLDHDSEAQQIAQRAGELARSLTFDAVINETLPRVRALLT